MKKEEKCIQPPVFAYLVTIFFLRETISSVDPRIQVKV